MAHELIYEMTADTLDAAELAAWSDEVPGLTLGGFGGLVYVTSLDVAARLVREPIVDDVLPAGRYLLVADVDVPESRQGILEMFPASVSARIDFTAAWTGRYVTAFDWVPDHEPAPPLVFAGIISGDSLILRRVQVIRVDTSSILAQLSLESNGPVATAGFQLGIDRLDQGRLATRDEAWAWTERLCESLHVDVQRGTVVEGVTTATEVGTAQIDVVSPADGPHGAGLRPNAGVRLTARASGSVAYTGTLDDLVDVPAPSDRRRKITTATVSDAVQTLAGRMRYGVDVIDGWTDRVRRLLDGAGIPWRPAPSVFDTEYIGPIMSRIVYESTLANHLQLVTNSSAGWWFVDANNVVVVEHSEETAQTRPTRLRFSDVHNPHDGLHRCIVDAQLAYSTATIVNDLVVSDHGAQWDEEQNDWRDDTVNRGPYRRPTSIATWGARASEVPTSLEHIGDPSRDLIPAPDPAGDLAAEYLARAGAPAPRITSVTWDATRDVDTACLIDVSDHIDVTFRGVEQPSRVLGIHHVITPHRWLATLTLAPRRYT